MARIPILRPGRHQGRGPVVNLTVSELSEIATGYDRVAHEAPVVIGHPKDGAAAHGWVRSLALEGDLLVAQAEQISADLSEKWRAGAIKKVSASLWLPDSPSNPHRGKWSLRHVGMLGAQVPAVKGLPPAELSGGEGDFVSLECVESTTKDLRIAALEAELAERDRQEANAEADALATELVSNGQVPPRQRDAMAAVLRMIPADTVVELEESDDFPVGELLREFLTHLPVQIEYAELAGGPIPDVEALPDFCIPQGFQVSAADAARYREVAARAKREEISFAEALERG